METAGVGIEVNHPTRRGFHYMKPPKFDGKTPLDEFIIAFDNCAEFNKRSSREKAAYLKNSLTGGANQLLRTAADDCYSELLAKLERRYGTKHQEEKYRTEIRCRQRRRDEPVTELAESIRGLMLLAYPGDQEANTNKAVARDAFLSALGDPDLEEKIRGFEPKGLDEACRMAQRFEIIHNAVHAIPTDQMGHKVRQVIEVAEEEEDMDQQVSGNNRRDFRRNQSKKPSGNRNTRAVEQDVVM